MLAEARGDTAQSIAIKVGREVASSGEVESVSVERSEAGCVVKPVDVPVDCEATVRLAPVPGGFVVTAERRGETFAFDSTQVRL